MPKLRQCASNVLAEVKKEVHHEAGCIQTSHSWELDNDKLRRNITSGFMYATTIPTSRFSQCSIPHFSK